MNTADYNTYRHPAFEGWVDIKLVSGLRFILAAFALIVTIIDPAEPDRYVTLTYLALTLYTIYSLAFVVLSFTRQDLIPIRLMHWLDVGWYLLLIALSSGTNSIFFNFFFFAILVGSFGWGLKTGLRLTLVSALLFSVVGIATAPAGTQFELNRFLIRSMQLLVLGYMISRWGGFKLNLWNQLQLLKGITLDSNPRFGIDRTLRAVLERVRGFYDADGCFMLMAINSDRDNLYQIHRVSRSAHSTGASPPVIEGKDAELFLPTAKNTAIIYSDDQKGKALWFDLNTRQSQPGDPAKALKVASALDTDHFLCVPIDRRNETIGCLYVFGARKVFDPPAMDFLIQLMDHVTMLVENVKLVDNLASDAAEQERRRIARDIHDSIIQPYLGLQLGISALANKLHTGNTNVLKDVNELLDLTNQELGELRQYVWGLHAPEERRNVLLPSIQRYVARFSAVTGIGVDVTTQGKIEISDRIAAELFQIVAEGLSNVRKHALCDEASVELSCSEGNVVVEIKNRRPQLASPAGSQNNGDSYQVMTFRPRSISERAELLGGQTEVLIDENNNTVVRVSIPL